MQEEQKNTNLPAGKKYTPSDILKFVIPSLIGIILFMLPIKEYDPEINQDKITIPIAFVASFIQNKKGLIKAPLQVYQIYIRSLIIQLLLTWQGFLACQRLVPSCLIPLRLVSALV